ncbi:MULTISPECIES: ShlB/FhaC/HecB family hemolysin secretion/activation protein [unclassified Ruegeria]|uniref:ShlB/FhaC/HecB family hemolysin secretion/activation protein n=1 Tax=unclassified Ruegeria TaxID=2625375 RepID=UPI0020C26E7C|nr:MULTISPECIES: ShlB/FhaC/HecB family hemolysin secretion/activation protein [unclassified Ruegeria]
MTPINKFASVASMIAALSLVTSGPAQAQSASNLAPSTFQPQNQRSTGPVTVARDPGAPIPEGADRLFVTVGGVDIQGALPQMAEANAAFAERLTGKRVAVSEIFAATNRLETAYTNAGYVLSRVVLPQQTLRDGGTLRIVVIDGFIERIDSAKVPDQARERVVAITQPLIGKRGVTLQQIERALLLAGDTFGLRLASTLSAGDASGATVLTLDGQFKQFTGSYGFDNTLSDELGPVNLSLGLEVNGALDLGETFYFNAGGAAPRYFSSDPQYRILAAGAVLPVGYDGLTLNAEFTASTAQPDSSFLPNESRFDRFSFRLYYPWIRSRKLNLSSQLILDRISDSQDILAGSLKLPIYDDDLSVLRATADASVNYENGSFLRGSAILSRGLDAFGASSTTGPGDTPLSRQGASAEFTKLVLSAQYQRPLSALWSLSVSGRVQTSFGDPLVTSEQFNIASSSELSTFDAGELRGDDGWVVRTEVGRSQQVTLAGVPLLLKPYAFGAYGELGLQQPTVFEQSTTTAFSYGIGLDLFTIEDSAYRSGSVRVEYGRGERDDLGQDGNRFTIVASRRF